MNQRQASLTPHPVDHQRECGARPETTAAASRIDQTLDRINFERQLAHSSPDSWEKCVLLADLATYEAACWEEQFERAKSRPLWLAALSAREFSLHRAKYWRARATRVTTAASLGQERGAAA